MTSSPWFVPLDVQALFSRSSADIAMFVTAFLVYWILQRLKASAAPLKTLCKDADDGERCSDHSNDMCDTQMPLPKAYGLEAKLSHQINAVQHQSECQKPEEGKVVQPQPKWCMPNKGPFNVGEQLALMRNYAAARNIKETLQAFNAIKQSGASVTSDMHNAVLQAWVNCGNIWAAENCLEEAKEAGLTDAQSFVILIKALVPIGDLEKVRALLQEMKEKVALLNITTYDEVVLCLARGGLFSDGISLLKHMHEEGVKPARSTLCAIAKLVNGARSVHQKCGEVWEVLSKYGFESKCIDEVMGRHPSDLPLLLAVISKAVANDSKKCIHAVEIKGSMAGVTALRATLEQQEFLDFHKGCLLRVRHDNQQDNAKREQIAAVLRCVSKEALHLPANLEEVVLQYLGSDVHCLRLNFESTTSLAVVVDDMSCLHPRVGFRHCWAKPSLGYCGQRTLSNGEAIDEASFNRHIHAVHANEMN